MNKKRTGKLGVKITRLIFIMMLFLGIALVWFSYISFKETFLEVYSDKAENTARMVADIIDGDRMSDYAHTLVKDDYYYELEALFSDLKMDSGASYLYLFYPEDDHLIYIIDAACEDDNKDTINNLGDIFEYEEMELKYLVPDVAAKKPSTELIRGQDVGFGTSVTAWAPIVDSNGNLVAYVESDYVMSVVKEDILAYTVVFAVIGVIGIVVILVVVILYIRRVLSKPLNEVENIMKSFKDGEFRLDGKKINTGDEIEDVYNTFEKMIAKIDDYVENITKITAEKGRIETELNVANQIQADMLPSIFPAFPGKKEIDIYATMRPAREVGGDFYDFFSVDEKHIAFVIADVSGKGVPAALFMVIAKTIMKNYATVGIPVNEVLENTNNQLCDGNKENYFVTAWLGIIDLETGEIEYANAGHNPPIIMRKDKCVWEQDVVSDFAPDLVLAAMEGIPYSKHSFKLEPGDRIFLYTDGVPESINTSEEAYGEETLIKEFETTRTKSLKEAIDYIQNSVDTFAGEEDQFDDITMLMLEYKGSVN